MAPGAVFHAHATSGEHHYEKKSKWKSENTSRFQAIYTIYTIYTIYKIAKTAKWQNFLEKAVCED